MSGRSLARQEVAVWFSDSLSEQCVKTNPPAGILCNDEHSLVGFRVALRTPQVPASESVLQLDAWAGFLCTDWLGDWMEGISIVFGITFHQKIDPVDELVFIKTHLPKE